MTGYTDPPTSASVDGEDITPASVKTAEALIKAIDDWNDPKDASPLRVLGSADGKGIILQNQDDSQSNGPGRANIAWFTHGDATGTPEQLAAITSHPTDNHFSVYTKADAIGSGDTGLQKRLDIAGGSGQTRSTFRNTGLLEVDAGTGVDTGFALQVGEAAGDSSVQFQDESSNTKWLLQHYRSADGRLRLRNPVDGRDVWAWGRDGAVNHVGPTLETKAPGGSAFHQVRPAGSVDDAGFRVVDETGAKQFGVFWDRSQSCLRFFNYGTGASMVEIDETDHTVTFFDSSGSATARIDPTGDLVLSGSVTENGNP